MLGAFKAGVMGAAGGGLSDPHYANVSLLLHGDGADASTTITDSGPYGLTPTLNGNVQIDTAQSQFGGASIEFDGTGDYLEYSTAPLWQLTGDYTIEFWLRITSAAQYDCVIGNWEASNSDAWLFFLNQGGNAGISFWVHAFNGGSGPFLSSTTNVHDGAWHNVAVSYDGTTTRLFVDGTLEDSSTASFTITSANSNKLHIGTQGFTLSRTITGHLDEIRITKGVCRYTGNYTVATEAFPEGVVSDLPDLYLPNVTLLLQPEAGDSAVEDKSNYAHTITEVGDAGVSASDVTGFDGRAIVLDGTGDWLTIPYSSGFAFGTGDFTVEAKIRQDVAASNWSVFDNRNAAYSAGTILGANSGNLRVYSVSGVNFSGAATINADTTYDVCWERTGNTWRIYLDGTVVATTTNASAFADGGSGDFYTGDQRPGATYQWDGHYTLRVTKGVARYQGAYTPPDRFSTIAAYSSSLLIHADGADTSTTFTDDSSNFLTVTANGDAQVDTAQSKFGGASCLLDGTGDYLAVTGGSALDFGTGDFTIDFWIRPNALSGVCMLWDQRAVAAGSYVVIYHDGTTLACNNNGTQILTHQTALTTGTWQHIALTRANGTTRLFLNGVVSSSTYSDSNSYSNGNGPYIGAYPLGGPSLFFNGWVDEIRVVVGTAAWSGSFTPPTAAYTG